jgi:hypothetical protein
VRERHAQLEHALRISTVGVLASGLAHELSQPLSAIANEVEACVQYVGSGKIDPRTLLKLLEEVSAEALRAGEIVDHLRGFIQKGEPQPEHADLGEIARQVARLLGHQLDREKIALRLEIEPRPIPIYTDRIQIEQVVINFMQNAIDAVREQGKHKVIALAVRTRDGRAELEVRDTGVGVPAAAGERLWEPFFTTQAPWSGNGPRDQPLDHRSSSRPHPGGSAQRRHPGNGRAVQPAAELPRIFRGRSEMSSAAALFRPGASAHDGAADAPTSDSHHLRRGWPFGSMTRSPG